VNHVKPVPDNDKGTILSFNVSLALVSPHYKINWPTCSNVVLPSSPLNLAPRVRQLIVVVGIRFLVGTSSTFRFYAKELAQDGSQLIS
jgi:hypothetical protein